MNLRYHQPLDTRVSEWFEMFQIILELFRTFKSIWANFSYLHNSLPWSTVIEEIETHSGIIQHSVKILEYSKMFQNCR